FRALDIVVFHTRAKEIEQASTDFAEMEKKHGFKMHDHPPSDIDWNDFPDLGELVNGNVAGRANAAQRTFFLNSTGCGAQYCAVCELIYAAARQKGLGQEIPDILFSEAIG